MSSARSFRPWDQLHSLRVQEAIELVQYYRPPPPPSLWDWSHRNRAIAGHPFNLDRYPCLVQVYRDESDLIILEKPNQMGASEWLINVTLHALDVGASYFGIEHIKNSLNVGYIFPTWTALKDFSKDRIRRVANETPYMAELLAPIKAGPLRRESDLGLYFVRNGALYLRGAYNPDDQLASFPVDLLIIDEYDLITARAVSLAEKRLRASPLRWKRYVSKPTLPNMGIDQVYQESDQQRWEIRCPVCGDWQPLDFWANVAREIKPGKVEHYEDWSKRPREELLQSDFIVACRQCSNKLDRSSKGRWRALNPDSNLRGYRIPGLAAPFVPLAEIVKGSLAEEPDLITEWYRADLGLPRSPEGGQLKWDDLEACKKEYPMEARGRRCTMGVDVGVKLHVRVGCYRDGQWQSVWLGTVDEFTDLDDFMRRYDVRSAVIDAAPETRLARDFCLKWPGRAWLATYVDQVAPREVYTWDSAENATEAGKVRIARTEAMDRVAARYRERTEGLPANVASVPDFYAQMCAPVRVLTKRKKQDGTHYEVVVYMETGPDHYYHASVYELAAREKIPPPATTHAGVTGSSAFD